MNEDSYTNLLGGFMDKILQPTQAMKEVERMANKLHDLEREELVECMKEIEKGIEDLSCPPGIHPHAWMRIKETVEYARELSEKINAWRSA